MRNVLDFHGRKTLVATTAMTLTGSTAIGVFDTNGYSRFVGNILCVGSMTFTYGLQINSGTTQITSSFVVNSGGAVFDHVNHTRWIDFRFGAVNSQSAVAVVILGEPLR